jgi:hypothetical protein
LRRLKNLRLIDFSDAKVGDEILADVGRVEGLGYLALNGTDISDYGLAHLAGLRRLSGIDVSATAVSGQGFKHLADLPIARVTARRNSLTKEGLHWLGRMSRLEALHLGGSNLEGRGLAYLNGFVRLRYLELADTSIDGSSLKLLSDLPSPGLSVQLDGVPIQDADLSNLALLELVSELSLKRTPLTDAGLEHLRQSKSLRVLWLPQSNVSEEAARLLSADVAGLLVGIDGKVFASGEAVSDEWSNSDWHSVWWCYRR